MIDSIPCVCVDEAGRGDEIRLEVEASPIAAGTG